MVLDFTPQRCLNYKRRRLQQVMLEFRDKLPQTMAFNIENLRYADELREGYYFHLTHALVHSMVVALHCPALFWASQSGSGTPPLSRMDVAWPVGIRQLHVVLPILSALHAVNPTTS